MKVFGQYWFLQGLVTACMLVGISATCKDNDGCTPPNGVCTVGKCVCKPDYAGPACASVNPCIGETCNNHGTCEPSEDATPVAVCTCGTGYTGTKCENDIDECTETGDDAHDCDKNAACTNTPPGSYTCTCNDGFVGDGKTCTVCTEDGDECLNGGTCDIPTGGTDGTCSCQSGYEGPVCADASGAARISVHILLITVVAVLAQLSLN